MSLLSPFPAAAGPATRRGATAAASSSSFWAAVAVPTLACARRALHFPAPPSPESRLRDDHLEHDASRSSCTATYTDGPLHISPGLVCPAESEGGASSLEARQPSGSAWPGHMHSHRIPALRGYGFAHRQGPGLPFSAPPSWFHHPHPHAHQGRPSRGGEALRPLALPLDVRPSMLPWQGRDRWGPLQPGDGLVPVHSAAGPALMPEAVRGLGISPSLWGRSSLLWVLDSGPQLGALPAAPLQGGAGAGPRALALAHSVRRLSAPASATSRASPEVPGAAQASATTTAQAQAQPQGGSVQGVSASAQAQAQGKGGSMTMEDLAEECDEAVEDLGEVRARARAAREAVRKGKGVLRASWLLVGAVASNTWRNISSLGVIFTWSRRDWAAKMAGWWRVVKHEAHHYWVGTKLLWADIRISSRLLLKTAKGISLTRRERQQLMRTSADIFRLVPFAVFVIVPFMEFLLPLALRLFPNMLPSTYQDAKQEEAKMKRVLQARLQMARFLQDTVQEMAKEIKGRRDGDAKKTAEELQKFMTKVRTGGRVSNEEIMGFATLFNDELTLDNMTRPRLISMCKYMGLQTFGTDAYLRYILRARLGWIKEDDKMIQAEGVDSLSEAELRAACRERGMLGLRDVATMRHQLSDWLDLSLNRSVPSSLLILSRSFLLAGKVRPEEAVQATLSSLPERVVASVEASVPAGDSTSERQRKLDKLREEEKLIKEEAEAEERRLKAVEEQRLRDSDRDRALAEMKEDLAHEGVDVVLGASAPSTGAPASLEDIQHIARANRDHLCDLSAALAVLASSSAVSKERVDFLRLVNREIELYNSLVEKAGSENEEEARAAYAAAREASDKGASLAPQGAEGVSEALINKVDSMLNQLEKELDRVDAKIGSKNRILDTDYDGKVTPEEVAAAAAFLRDSLGQGQVPELIASLAKDRDGKILVEDIVRLGTMDTSSDNGVKSGQGL